MALGKGEERRERNCEKGRRGLLTLKPFNSPNHSRQEGRQVPEDSDFLTPFLWRGRRVKNTANWRVLCDTF